MKRVKDELLVILIHDLAIWQIVYLYLFIYPPPPFSTLNYTVKYHVSYHTYRLVYDHGTTKSLLVGMIGHATNPSGNTGRCL
jgi:hypothetical protein